ncbi:MAG TPA: hypothetical protein PKO43_02080, partial [Bacilli bacterium]|nr:hypothetical protein [Bacilli bacterium]
EKEVVYYNTVYEENDLENPVHIEYQLKFTIAKVENRRIREVIMEVIRLDEDSKKTEDENNQNGRE